ERGGAASVLPAGATGRCAGGVCVAGEFAAGDRAVGTGKYDRCDAREVASRHAGGPGHTATRSGGADPGSWGPLWGRPPGRLAWREAGPGGPARTRGSAPPL